MSEGSRRAAWVVGAIAAAAGVATLSYFFVRRSRADGGASLESVADVLSECHRKMHEIQDHLSELSPTLQQLRTNP